MRTVSSIQRHSLKSLLIPLLGANPSSQVVEPFVGKELASSLPTANAVSQVADWIIDRLLEQDSPDKLIEVVGLVDNSSSDVEPLLGLVEDLKSGSQVWRPQKRSSFKGREKKIYPWASILLLALIGFLMQPSHPLDEFTASLDPGTYPADLLVGVLAKNAGSILVATDLETKLRGRKVEIPRKVTDLALRPLLDSIFERLGIEVEYRVDNGTILIIETQKPSEEDVGDS